MAPLTRAILLRESLHPPRCGVAAPGVVHGGTGAFKSATDMSPRTNACSAHWRAAANEQTRKLPKSMGESKIAAILK